MSIQNELFYMKTFPVPLLSCHVPLLYAFHFFILVKQDKKKIQASKKITRSARDCLVGFLQSLSIWAIKGWMQRTATKWRWNCRKCCFALLVTEFSKAVTLLELNTIILLEVWKGTRVSSVSNLNSNPFAHVLHYRCCCHGLLNAPLYLQKIFTLSLLSKEKDCGFKPSSPSLRPTSTTIINSAGSAASRTAEQTLITAPKHHYSSRHNTSMD